MNALTVSLFLSLLVLPISAADDNPEQNIPPLRYISIANLDNQTSEKDSHVSLDILYAKIEVYRSRKFKSKQANQGWLFATSQDQKVICKIMDLREIVDETNDDNETEYFLYGAPVTKEIYLRNANSMENLIIEVDRFALECCYDDEKPSYQSEWLQINNGCLF
jgi:hypothetical protein